MRLLTVALLSSITLTGVLGQACLSNADCTRGEGSCVGASGAETGGCVYIECYAGYFEAGAYSCGVCPAGTSSDPNGGDPSDPPVARCYQPCADGSKCYTPYGGSATCSGTPSTCVQTCDTAGNIVYEGDGSYAYCGAPPSTPSRRAIVKAREARSWNERRPW